MIPEDIEKWINENACTLDQGKAYCILAEDIRTLLCSLSTYDAEKEVVVPREPTEEMLKAARDAPIPAVFLDSFVGRKTLEISTQYKAMLKAAEGDV